MSKHILRLARRPNIAWLLFASSCAAALLTSPTILSGAPSEDWLQELRAQVDVGEFQVAIDEVSEQIETIKSTRGSFDAWLAEPYVLLGDAQLGIGEANAAAESFSAALNVTKINEGLKSTAQVRPLYRLSDAMVATGEFQQANEAQERAFALMRNELGPNNPQLLPAILLLIDWYESNRRYFAAKILYMEAIRIADQVIPVDDLRRIELSRAFVEGMRNTVYPPMDNLDRFRGFEIQVPGYEPPPPGSTLPSSYLLGLHALNEVIRLVETHAPDDVQNLATAKLNLADWHQLFGRESKATRLYREIWLSLESRPEHRASLFDDPKLLYIRLPKHDIQADPEPHGIVELLLTVSYRGSVTGRISQTVEPPDDYIEFRTRVAARESRFRPALRDGKPVTTRNFPLTHYYRLPD